MSKEEIRHFKKQMQELKESCEIKRIAIELIKEITKLLLSEIECKYNKKLNEIIKNNK